MTSSKSISPPTPLHWRFPESAQFGRIIPKDKLYQQIGASAALKQRFVEQVGQIKWAYKLAEGTLNLAKTDSVAEIEVIHITLKANDLDTSLLAAIDKAIPQPTLFVLKRQQTNGVSPGAATPLNAAQTTEQIRITAAHKVKLTSATGKAKWQQSQYLSSAWCNPAALTAQPLPTATNLERLYEQLLEALLPPSPEPDLYKPALSTSPQAAGQVNEAKKSDYVCGSQPLNLEEKLATLAEVDALTKKLKQVKAKRDKEKQFNRRRELNDSYKALKQQIATLQASI